MSQLFVSIYREAPIRPTSFASACVLNTKDESGVVILKEPRRFHESDLFEVESDGSLSLYQFGTPQTLKVAILNAMADYPYTEGKLDVTIEAHVRDFLAQKFSVAMMTDNKDVEDAISKLWKMIQSK